jgi:hypothetical protein
MPGYSGISFHQSLQRLIRKEIMGQTLAAIRIDRLLLALAITFLVVDTYPHPSLGPGLVESLITRGIVTLTPQGEEPQTFAGP